MELPVKFPSETEVILEDVTRFRALSPRDQMRSLRGLLADGVFVIGRISNRGAMERVTEEQRRLKHQAIREFIARHER